MFQDASDDDVGSVAHTIDVDLDGVVEETIDQDRIAFRRVERRAELRLELALIVDDLHRAPTEYVTRTHQQRVADSFRDLDRAVE